MTRFAGKYETAEQLEAAYNELQKTLGNHGNELGTLRQQLQALAEENQGLTQYATQLTPLAAWYRENQPRIQQWWQGQQRPAQQPAAPVNGYAAASNGWPAGWESLNEQQRFNLMIQAAGGVAQQHALRTLQAEAPKYAKQVEDRFSNQYKHATDVLWRTFERILPKDQLDRARQYHEESLKYANAEKLNPMDLARERLDMQAERDTYKTQLDELTKKEEARAKAAVPSLGATPTVKAFDRGKEQAKLPDREERFRAVMNDVTESVGAESVRDQFPALR